MFDSILEQQKIDKAKEFKNAGVNPYPHFLKKEYSIQAFKEKFAYILSDESSLEKAYEEINQKREEDCVVKVLYRNKNFKFQKESLERDGYEIVEVN